MGDVGTGIAHTEASSSANSLNQKHLAMQSEHYGPTSSASTDRSNLGYLNQLNPEKPKQTKDGQPAKRRGPKPDSKPALTRRQELNRQAQRTHRERKEMYIKALEQEVLRLKDVFTTFVQERDAVAEENRRLKELLAAHGISYDFGTTPIKFQRESSGYGPSSSGSISGSYATGSESTNYTPPPVQGGPTPSPTQYHHQRPARTMAQLPNTGIDYDQVGIDFVLTYDSQGRPIMPAYPAPYPSPPAHD